MNMNMKLIKKEMSFYLGKYIMFVGRTVGILLLSQVTTFT